MGAARIATIAVETTAAALNGVGSCEKVCIPSSVWFVRVSNKTAHFRNGPIGNSGL